MKHYLLFFLLVLSLSIQSQTYECGYMEDVEHRNTVRELLSDQSTIEGQNGLNSIPVVLHFFQRSDSTGGYYEGIQDSILNMLNANFYESRLHFYTCGDPILIYNDTFYDYQTSQFTDLIYESYQQNKLNIHILGSINGGALCGTYQGIHSVQVAYPCAGEAATVAHEIGHYLELPHTFGPTSTTTELADGSNCETAGDQICDTPADPNRIHLINSDCFYHGTVEDSLGYPDTIRDANGDAYHPDVHNIMSYYGVFGCRDRFSPQQGTVMNAKAILQLNSYYKCPGLFTDFTMDIGTVSCENTLEVSLNANTDNPGYMYFWDIDDDGEVDYTSHSVMHTYTEPGKYTISLEVYHPDQDISIYRTRYQAIQISDETIEAPLVFDFESGIDFPYITTQNAGLFNWEVFPLVDGNKVGYNVAEPDAGDDLIFHIDLTEIGHPILEFDYAYHNGIPPGDTLVVSILTCDGGFVDIFKKGGDELNTLPTNGHPIAPSDWGYASIPISEYANSNIQIRFQTRSDEGGYFALFLDNVVIKNDESSAVTHEPAFLSSIYLVPNPASNQLRLNTNEMVEEYQIIDLSGKMISRGFSSRVVDISQLEQGIYFISMRLEGHVISRRFVKM